VSVGGDVHVCKYSVSATMSRGSFGGMPCVTQPSPASDLSIASLTLPSM
jgi:hypothetical protein